MAPATPPGSALFAHMCSLNKTGWHRGARRGPRAEERRAWGARWCAGGAQLSGSVRGPPLIPRARTPARERKSQLIRRDPGNPSQVRTVSPPHRRSTVLHLDLIAADQRKPD
ncbi:hypothetical protein GN956_G10367 [Arapaima gigas]